MLYNQTGLNTCLPGIAYTIVFGMKCEDGAAKKSFSNGYLKDTMFGYSNNPTIADLVVVPVLTFLKVVLGKGS